MFGFLKKLLIKFVDNSVDSMKITDTDWEKYRQEVFYSAKNKRNFLIGNFSFKGFNYIFDALIENTECKLVFFIKNFESVFDKSKFEFIEYRCLKRGITVFVYTYDGKEDERFLELSKKYSNFKYVSLKLNNGKTNNFIVSDYHRYWIEESESSMVRNDMNYNGFFKACTNFYDYEMVNKLMSLIEKIDM